MARPGGEAYLRSMSDLCGCADFEPSSGFVRAGGVQERCFSLFPLTLHQQEPERARGGRSPLLSLQIQRLTSPCSQNNMSFVRHLVRPSEAQQYVLTPCSPADPPPRTPRPSYLHLRHGHLRRSVRSLALPNIERLLTASATAADVAAPRARTAIAARTATARAATERATIPFVPPHAM